MSRVFESNGPDVKVRGTAQHVADKYLQLARDAHSSGDRVMAESYYQHAEHYLRILAAANSFSQQNYPQQSNPQYQQRRPGDEEDFDEGGETAGSGDEEQPGPVRQPTPVRQPAPVVAAPVAQVVEEPRPVPGPALATGDGEAADQTWGGPQPDFLRRGPGSNGTGRTRRPRPPRSSVNGQKDAAGTPQPAAGEADAPAQDTTE